MAADRRFECAQCILLHSVGNRRDQQRAVNLLRGLRAIVAAPAVLQLVVVSRFRILQFLREFFGFDLRYHALHSQLLTLPIHTLLDPRRVASPMPISTLTRPRFLCCDFAVPFAFQSPRSYRPSIRVNSQPLPFCANDTGMGVITRFMVATERTSRRAHMA